MAEPILWANKAQRTVPARRFNEASGVLEDVFDEDTGKRVIERVPQLGHVSGDYDNPVLSRHARWVHVLRHDGHVVRVPLTNAAADIDTDSLFARQVRAKARYFGWIPVGFCPLLMVITGDLQAGQIIAKDIRGGSPCTSGTHGEERPCPHYLAEEKARKALQSKESAKIERTHRTEADKLIAAQQSQTTEIVSGISGALTDAVRELAQARVNDDGGGKAKK